MRSSCLLLAVLLAACATAGEDPGATLDAPKQDGVDAAAIDGPGLPPVDAPVDAPSPIDGGVDAPQVTAPDTCVQATELTAMAASAGGVTLTGNTTGYADDVRTGSSCTGYVADGPDAIYLVNLAAGQTVTATGTPAGWDLSLELVNPCAATPTCLRGADSGVDGDPESATYTATAATAVYVVVDGYNPGIAGAYSLNVRVQ